MNYLERYCASKVYTCVSAAHSNRLSFALFNHQEPKDEGEDEDEIEEEEEKDKKVNQEFLVCAFECLGRSWPKNAVDSQGNL